MKLTANIKPHLREMPEPGLANRSHLLYQKQLTVVTYGNVTGIFLKESHGLAGKVLKRLSMFAVGIDECWHVELIVFRFIKVRTKTGMITVTFIIQHYSTQCMKKNK